MLSGTTKRADEIERRWICETCIQEASPRNFSGRAALTGKDNTVWQSQCERYMLWIDGVGAWQLCVGQSFLIGGPTLEHQSADICLMANISRKHATLTRIQENWFIQPHSSTVLSGRTVAERALLKTGDEIRLADRVRLGFRIPSVLSSSALIDFESQHRPAHSVNGIILMADTCLLGPRRDHHVYCPEWSDLVVLFVHAGRLRCRSRIALKVNEERIRDSAELNDGDIVTGDDLRFRVERMKNMNT